MEQKLARKVRSREVLYTSETLVHFRNIIIQNLSKFDCSINLYILDSSKTISFILKDTILRGKEIIKLPFNIDLQCNDLLYMEARNECVNMDPKDDVEPDVDFHCIVLGE